MTYKNYKISILKNGYFTGFNFATLKKAGPQKTIKELRAEIDAAENSEKNNLKK